MSGFDMSSPEHGFLKVVLVNSHFELVLFKTDCRGREGASSSGFCLCRRGDSVVRALASSVVCGCALGMATAGEATCMRILWVPHANKRLPTQISLYKTSKTVKQHIA